MQTQVSTAYMNTLKQNVALAAQARLTAEWNHNRFAGPPAVINTGQTYPDSDEFPLDSIVAPGRPRKQGLAKARARNRAAYNSSNVAQGYAQAKYDDSSTAAGKRAYTVSPDSKYKYWSSPTTSGTSLTSGYYAIDSGSLEITYTKDIWMNRLRAVFEASVVQPKNITIFYKTTAAGAWTQWAGTFQVDTDGVLSLYRQNDGTMSTTEYLLNPLKIRGIKVVVAGLSAPSAYLDVIEISARLRSDLSTFVVDYNVNNNMSEPSLVTPLGICSSNEANVTLDNIDGRFDNDRATLLDSGLENLFYGIIDKNVRMWVDLGLNVNETYEYTRQFTMWSDEWGSQNQDTVSVSLKDSSKIPQETKPNATLYQGLTTAGIVWRMCDAIGFNNYNISTAALNDNHIIDYFWTDPEKTVWEHFQEIAEGTQTAIFFDENDVLQVLPRKAAYDLTKPVSWTFDGEEVGSNAVAQGRPSSDDNKLSDIIELEQTYDFEANVANVKYIPTTISQPQGNVIPMEEVWAPEDDVVLRSSRLIQTMASNATSFRITPTEAKVWPYTGTIQVEGEFIKYTSKGYTYRNASNAWVSAYVASEEERLKRDAENPSMAAMNYFNGYFYTGAAGRGMYGTTAAAHNVTLSDWTYNRITSTNRGGFAPVKAWNGGIMLNTNDGVVKLSTNKTFGRNTWYTCTRGSRNDAPPYWYGTRMRFPNTGNTYGAAGLAISAGDYDSGYYVEVIRTDKMSVSDRNLYTHELCFYVKYHDGTIRRLGPNGNKGVPLSIAPGVWYDLDVHLEWQNAIPQISIMVNGVTRLTTSIPSGYGFGESTGGRYGFFTRGDSCAEFEYIYASTYAVNDTFDQPGWFDRITGGYQSSQYDREWTYLTAVRNRWKTGHPLQKVVARYASRLMDEFSPVVHEVREYDVKFDKTPVIYSTLYLSNDKQVICPEYNSNPFGAKFVVANTARVNAILNGEDTLTFGSDNPVEQKMLIYGRLVNKGEEKTATVKNDAAVNRRGTVEVDVSSDWIQSETAANEIGTWITQNWGGGSSEVKVTAIGNPLLQLGDIVAIQHPDKSMTYATHKYFVVGIEHSFDGGLDTNFTLRRAKL
jgi:hypothetical protein